MIKRILACMLSLFLAVPTVLYAEPEDEGSDENLGATPTPSPTPTPTQYYTYSYYGLRDNGNILGININKSRIKPLVLSTAYDNKVSYAMFFIWYVGSYATYGEANEALSAYGLKGVPKYIDNANSISWSYGSLLNGGGAVGSYTTSQGTTAWYYYTYIGYLQSAYDRLSNDYYLCKGAYCWNNTDLWTYIGANNNSVTNMVQEYVRFKLLGQMNRDYTIGEVPAKTWLKSGETIAPIIDVDNLPQGDGQGDSGGSGGGTGGDDTPGTEPGDDGSGGSGGTMSQQQTQTIASGALTQSQSIAEGAVSVEVTNNNSMSQEQRSWIDSVIQNFDINGGSSGDQNGMSGALQGILGVTNIAKAWVSVIKEFLALFPGWVTTVFSVAMTIVSIAIVFRVIHLFI